MKKMYYEICSCNPANGGNGICGCTMGNRLVDTDNTYTTITTTTTGALIDKIKPQMKQTAVEWLVDQLKEYDFADIKDSENYIIKIPAWILTEKEEQAKEMEKKQIEDAWIATDNQLQRLAAKKYYNETYGGDK
jgi:hypothetical protein